MASNHAEQDIERIHSAAARWDGSLRVMEVCGTHTHAIARAGLRSLFPDNVELVSGPGCPVCVTSQRDIERMISLGRMDNVTLCTFGDMIRVPGNGSSLEKERGEGADVRIVYSPLDALRVAREEPEREIVFLAVGFETTAPVVAATLQQAAQQELSNFSLYVCHKLVLPAMEAVLQEDAQLHGFLTPGHVSAIIGSKAYEDLAQRHDVACVVTGFEPEDILEGMADLCEKIADRQAGSFIQYRRVVRPEGNPKAREILYTHFEPGDAEWRGLGVLPMSGLVLKREYARYDAVPRFDIPDPGPVELAGCRCGDVLRGILKPDQCPLFASQCTPRNPVGPCMVSSEGSCAARYRYGA